MGKTTLLWADSDRQGPENLKGIEDPVFRNDQAALSGQIVKTLPYLNLTTSIWPLKAA